MIIKFILKCITLPLLLPIILIQWTGIFLNSITSVVFGILSGIVTLTAPASFSFGQSTGNETARILIIAFVVFIIPHIGNWIIEKMYCFGVLWQNSCNLDRHFGSRLSQLNKLPVADVVLKIIGLHPLFYRNIAE